MKYRKILFSMMVLVLTVLLGGCHETSSTPKNQSTTEPQATSTEYVQVPLTTTNTDSLKLTKTYQGKDFFTDRIGQVTLNRCVDGDTAVFENDHGRYFTVRFQGIDTPESTIKIDPWGKAASEFTCEKLTNAKTIVLEGDEEILDSTGSRYMAWVWYDGRLLNLELMELAYAKPKSYTGTIYEDIMYKTDMAVQKTGRRVWGEKDPNYDYSNTVTQLTIKELRDNFETYKGKKVQLGGIVTRRLVNNAYLEDEGYGVYIYAGFTLTEKLTAGYQIRITATVGEYNGQMQLVDIASRRIDVASTDNEVVPNEVTISDINSNSDLLATFLKVKQLEVTSVYKSTGSESFTIHTKDQNGKTLDVRVDGGIYPRISSTPFTVGRQFDINAVLGQYEDTNQLLLASMDDITFLN